MSQCCSGSSSSRIMKMNAPFLLWLLLPGWGAAYKTPTMRGKKANPPSRSKGAGLQNLKWSTPRSNLASSDDLRRSWQITNKRFLAPQRSSRVRILNPRPRDTEQAWLLWGKLKRKVVGLPRSHPELPLLWSPPKTARNFSSVS